MTRARLPQAKQQAFIQHTWQSLRLRLENLAHEVFSGRCVAGEVFDIADVLGISRPGVIVGDGTELSSVVDFDNLTGRIKWSGFCKVPRPRRLSVANRLTKLGLPWHE